MGPDPFFDPLLFTQRGKTFILILKGRPPEHLLGEQIEVNKFEVDKFEVYKFWGEQVWGGQVWGGQIWGGQVWGGQV